MEAAEQEIGRTADSWSYRILVAMETDATRYYGASASRPALLAPSDAERMLAQVAADMQALLPDIGHCCLVAAGAVYDQTQILRPGFPVFRALEAMANAGGNGHCTPRLISVGATGGAMPVGELQPLPDIPLGLLQLLPVVIHAPMRMDGLADAIECRFLEEGQLSAHSAAWLQSAFGVTVNHARLMTLTDLNAMLRLQLEHFGFLALWDLLDAALTGRDEPLDVVTAGGQVLEWRSGAVHADFTTFDHWAREGAGKGLPASRQALAEGYAAWTRELRQYLTTLGAHGLTVRLHSPGREEPLEGAFFAEVSDTEPGPADCAVTEHHFDELGAVAVTVVDAGRIENLYPLAPRGLNEIHARLRQRIPGGHTVAFPGTILYDEETRALRPEVGQRPDGACAPPNDS